MNWDAIGAVGEILGATGVFASLVYLATQIRDNTRSLGAASLQSVLDGPRDRWLLPLASSDETSTIFSKGLTSLDLLDDAGKRRFFYLLVEQYFQMQQVMHLHERGLIPEVDYAAWLKWAVALTRTPGGGEMWLQIQTMITPTIAELINGQLEADRETPSLLEVMPVFRYRDA
ncbi:MAG: hypothetical protein ACQGVC_13450 [Myxococcota bacterium]